MIHQGQPVRQLFPDLQDALAVFILLHGHGTAESVLPMAEAFEMDELRFMLPKPISIVSVSSRL